MVRLTNDEKILFGSVLASLAKRKILGDEVNVKPLSLLNALIKSEKFAIAQYDNGNQDYYEKVIKIKKLITDLKNKCGEICAYRERHVSPEISTFCGTVPTPEPNECFDAIQNIKDTAGNLLHSNTLLSGSSADQEIADSQVTNSDNSFVLNILAEGSGDLPDIPHTDTDGTAVSLPAQTPMVCTPGGNAEVNVRNTDSSYSVDTSTDLILPDVTHTDSDGSPVSLPGQTPFVATSCPTLVDGVVVNKDSDGNILHTTPVANNSSVDKEIGDSSITNSDGSFNDTVLAEGSKTLPDVDHIDSDGSTVSTPAQTVFTATTCPTLVNASQIPKTGQVVSYYNDDDGVTQRGRNVDFLTLDHNNKFGNTNRFTDDLGTQVYANDVVIDWSTYDNNNNVTAYKKTIMTPNNWEGACFNQPYTHSTYNDWYITNFNEYLHICDKGILGSDYLNYAPFNISVSNLLWTGGIGENSLNVMVHYSSGFISNAKQLIRTFLITRTYTMTELGL